MSYWDPAHHGELAGAIEFAVVIAAAAWMYIYRAPLRPWVTAITGVYLLYWIYVYAVWI